VTRVPMCLLHLPALCAHASPRVCTIGSAHPSFACAPTRCVLRFGGIWARRVGQNVPRNDHDDECGGGGSERGVNAYSRYDGAPLLVAHMHGAGGVESVPPRPKQQRPDHVPRNVRMLRKVAHLACVRWRAVVSTLCAEVPPPGLYGVVGTGVLWDVSTLCP
jgi:hypothetical protein